MPDSARVSCISAVRRVYRRDVHCVGARPVAARRPGRHWCVLPPACAALIHAALERSLGASATCLPPHTRTAHTSRHPVTGLQRQSWARHGCCSDFPVAACACLGSGVDNSGDSSRGCSVCGCVSPHTDTHGPTTSAQRRVVVPYVVAAPRQRCRHALLAQQECRAATRSTAACGCLSRQRLRPLAGAWWRQHTHVPIHFTAPRDLLLCRTPPTARHTPLPQRRTWQQTWKARESQCRALMGHTGTRRIRHALTRAQPSSGVWRY